MLMLINNWSLDLLLIHAPMSSFIEQNVLSILSNVLDINNLEGWTTLQEVTLFRLSSYKG